MDIDWPLAISGMGLINPLGKGVTDFEQCLVKDEFALAPISHFDATDLNIRFGGEVLDFDPSMYMSLRLARKSDRFAHLAIAAISEALAISGWNETEDPQFRSTGLFVGNNSGGWDICERGFREYYGKAPSLINPFQATAWFPAAAQGFSSIRFGITGYSKSFASDRCSGMHALFYAARMIRWGRCRRAVVAGTEAPLTRLGVLGMESTGELSHATNVKMSYSAYHKDSSGLVLGEGSAAITVESLDELVDRGERPKALIYGVSLVHDRNKNGLAKYVYDLISHAGISANRVQVVYVEAAGTYDKDKYESEQLQCVFRNHKPIFSAPKLRWGHQYGANALTEIICAILGFRGRYIPGSTQELSSEMYVAPTPEYFDMSHDFTLVIAGSRNNDYGVCLLGSPDSIRFLERI